ncbi:MAG: flagellar hook protein FliD [Gammaproteobacteria bacterium]|nr:MAG: flagellar hook protein FliD [Gammaproteobacteria bacterium]
MAITATGIGSGLNVDGLINQLLTLESKPVAQLDRKEAAFQAKISAYGSIKGALSSFQTAVRGLTDLARFQGLKATPADSTIYTASASSTAAPGDYAIEVTQLAQAHKLVSNNATFASVADVVGTGTLNIQVNGVSTQVVIGSTSNTLAGVRDAINNTASTGVTASIVNDGVTNRLVLTARSSGVANSLKITVSGDGDGNNLDNSGLSRLAYDSTGGLGTGKNLAETAAAQDASIKVDGLTITKSTNTITDAIQGVTLNLLKKSDTGVTTGLNVARDTATIKASVNTFVKAYNDINKAVADLTAYNATTRQGAILQGDAAALSIQRQIRNALTAPIAGLSGNLTLLSQIGVSFQKNGSLAVDGAKLDSAIASNFNDIAGLFSAVGKPSDSLINYVSATTNTKAGTYEVQINNLATQGNAKGAAAPDLTISAGSNDTLSLAVDDVTASVTLAPATYGSYAALAAEVQAKINGASALSAAGIAVTVTVEAGTNKLIITSNRYGSASSVANITGNAQSSLLGTPVSTAGVDVAGSINGVDAAGNGQELTGATGNAAEGIKLRVIGGATGDRGTVSYSQGYAYQLDRLADQLLAGSGPVTSRTDGINKSIADIGKQRDVLNQRLVNLERRLRSQFTALDGLVSRLRSTSDFLTQQLTSISKISAK